VQIAQEFPRRPESDFARVAFRATDCLLHTVVPFDHVAVVGGQRVRLRR
jgi:hypothetical protein